jgi:PAS domain S-box-containing protein
VNPESIAQKQRNTSRAVYALAAILITTFTLIIALLELQKTDADYRRSLMYDYHLAISNKCLGMMDAIKSSRLWFDQQELNNLSRNELEETDMLSLWTLDRQDQLNSLTYQLKKAIGEIEALQNHYGDAEYEAATNHLLRLHQRFETNIAQMLTMSVGMAAALDSNSRSLIPTIHQLQRLHQLAYQDLNTAGAHFSQSGTTRILGLVAILVLLGLSGMIAMLRQVRRTLSELIDSQQETLRERDFATKLIDTAPVIILLLDKYGRIEHCNPHFQQLVGQSLEEMRGKNWFDQFVPTRNREQARSWFQHHLEDPARDARVEAAINPLLLADGEERYIEWHGRVIYTAEGAIERTLSIGQDVTDRLQSEAELQRYRTHLEELVQERTRELKNTQKELLSKSQMAALGQLTATVSHELRNPLGAMHLSLFVIQKGLDMNNKKLQEAVQRLERNIDRCDNLVEELLDFTRSTQLDRHVLKIDSWLNALIDEQEILPGIHLERDLTLPGLEIYADGERLRRAVINLITNSCQAMVAEEEHPPHARRGSKLCVGTRRNEGRIEVVVTDNGSGIAADVMAMIFEPLYSTKAFGVGLGMPTVKQIMEQHGGGIRVSSEPGKATIATLWLPAEVTEIPVEKESV